ncbi:alpha/beta fold hydrolase [Pseudonocardia sichuanensis]|uniref:Haloacetate dehalogenase n=1 Tax=Pseudonocardia kunmingensis TaxID=630975 RepID=A0A543DLQ4_9PSEU|nr:alpha/beta hydrolase [Pseudonocardia kunmingensis]TQM10222.1 haloacetate dehalogenase [Pseudonocardia kunmingensis]
MILDGFATADVETAAGARVRVRTAGSGPPVVLLHGYPQTSAMWHLVAPGLARDHTVVLADLRGYGDSVAPPGAEGDVAAFGKRAMAAEVVAVMGELGFDRFAVVGHDRGARCAYRLALDHPQAVTALGVLDVLPTADVFARVDAAFARAAWHWFFLAQPGDLPERLIAADPDGFFLRGTGGVFAPEAVAAYRAAYTRPEVVHAMCQDYRAGATVDVADDEADRGVRTIGCPTLVLWGRHGPVGRVPDAMDVWRSWAPAAEGVELDCGHHVAEERPAETLLALQALLRS